MTVAILCSGQGGQHRNMFALTGDIPEAEPVFAAAAPLLDGVDPRAFVRDAPENALFANRAGQILCCVQAAAAWAMLGDARPARAVLAGYSVGELAAWSLTGLIPPAELPVLAAVRAEAMDRAAPERAGLMAVSGLRRSGLEALLREAGGSAAIAINNADDAHVIGGPDAVLDRVAARPGLRTTRLRVAVPSHTPSMRRAADAFAGTLAARSWPVPDGNLLLLNSLDGAPVRDAAAGAAALAGQIAREVRWSDCLRTCAERGVTVVLELGPGAALSRMAGSAVPGAECRAVDQFRTVSGVRDWLRRRTGNERD